MFDLDKAMELVNTAMDSIDEETRERFKEQMRKYILTHKEEYIQKGEEILGKYLDVPAVQELLKFLKK